MTSRLTMACIYIYTHIYLFVIKYIIQSWCIMSLDYKRNLETDKENGEVILIQRKQSHLQIKPLSLGWVTCTNLLPHFFVFQARLHHYLYHFRVAALWCIWTLSKGNRGKKASSISSQVITTGKMISLVCSINRFNLVCIMLIWFYSL